MNKTILPILALAALTGCISFGEEPPPFLMTLTADQQVAAGDSRAAATGQAITIHAPAVPQRLATTRLPVQTSDTAVAYLTGALWVDSPAELFRGLLSEVVAARTGRVVLNPAQFTSDPGTVVTGELQEFGLDAPAGEVVIVYDAVITGTDGVRTRRFEAREPVFDEQPQTVAQALNRAANRLAAEFSGWLAG